jgi:hypothetical protein
MGQVERREGKLTKHVDVWSPNAKLGPWVKFYEPILQDMPNQTVTFTSYEQILEADSPQAAFDSFFLQDQGERSIIMDDSKTVLKSRLGGGGIWSQTGRPPSTARGVARLAPNPINVMEARWDVMEARWDLLETRWDLLETRWDLLESRLIAFCSLAARNTSGLEPLPAANANCAKSLFRCASSDIRYAASQAAVKQSYNEPAMPDLRSVNIWLMTRCLS